MTYSTAARRPYPFSSIHPLCARTRTSSGSDCTSPPRMNRLRISGGTRFSTTCLRHSMDPMDLPDELVLAGITARAP